jgi:hypothetical protein
MSLQNMVDEILLKKNGKVIKKPADRQKLRLTPFLTRNKTLIHQRDEESGNEGDDYDEVIQRDNEANKKDLAENDDFISNDDL